MVHKDTINIKKIDNTYIQIIAERSVIMELSQQFEFRVDGYKFMPAYKTGMWDGFIRLLDIRSGKIYAGLLNILLEKCNTLDIDVVLDDTLKSTFEKFNFDQSHVNVLSKLIKIKYELRDYQILAIITAIQDRRAILVCPTGSGKSLIIYTISRYYNLSKKRVLIITPLTQLVSQLKKDFIDYNNDEELDIHTISAGITKETLSPIVISTWQSIFRLEKKWFEQFDVIIGDEVHLFEANSLKTILEKSNMIKYRFGLTGSLKDTKTNELVLQGLFGPTKKIISTKDLIDNNTLANLQIKALVLNYQKDDYKDLKSKKYQDEIDWIIKNQKRMIFIKNLTKSLNGNILLIFQYVDKHGKEIYEYFKNNIPDKNIHLIHGAIKVEEREIIRNQLETSTNNVLIASSGTFSTGINVVNLDHLILSSPTKSKIKSLQTIGRVLRKGSEKDKATVWDIVDNVYGSSKRKCYAIKHFIERSKIYDSEQFDYKIINVDIK